MMDKTVKDVEEFIKFSYEYNRNKLYSPLQVKFKGNKIRKKEFVEYLVKVSEISQLQELTGIQRRNTDKSEEYILSKIDNDAFVGIKIVHFPMYDFREYDKWEGGYVEGFLRTMDAVDYFIWTYAKMGKLKDIVSRFKSNLYY